MCPGAEGWRATPRASALLASPCARDPGQRLRPERGRGLGGAFPARAPNLLDGDDWLLVRQPDRRQRRRRPCTTQDCPGLRPGVSASVASGGSGRPAWPWAVCPGGAWNTWTRLAPSRRCAKAKCAPNCCFLARIRTQNFTFLSFQFRIIT